MENTRENELRFKAQYLYVDVIGCTVYKPEGTTHEYMSLTSEFLYELRYREAPIWLTPLEKITNEDARKLNFKDALEFLYQASTYFYKDQLRQMGYAIEWNNISVEKQIDWNWIKLKQ